MSDSDVFYAWLCVLGAALGLWRGIPLLARALRGQDHPDAALRLARGARWSIAALALLCIAVGLWSGSDAFLLFGIVFLLEELYETTAVVWILSWGKKRGFI